MSVSRYIAVDLGAESGRLMLATLQAGRLALEEVCRFANGPLRIQSSLRWNTAGLWREIVAGLRQVAARGVPVAGVSVDSWGLDYVLMRAGEPQLGLPFCYRDSRTDAPYAEVLGNGDAPEIFARTGIQFMPINTLYQLLADTRRDPAFLGSAERFLMIGDWFHFLLSGTAAQEASNASTTQIYDPVAGQWSWELIRRFGLPAAIFPEVVPPCTRLGPLLEDVRNETGLGPVEVVAGCTHDTGAAVAAVPARGERWAYLSSGTWSLLGVELPKPLINEAVRRANFTNEIGCGGTSRFLKNVVGLWILQECRRDWAQQGRHFTYETLTRLAADAEPLRSLIHPDDPRFARPDRMPDKIREFCRETGQPVPETPGQVARCVLESLALLYRQVLEKLEELTGVTVEVLHIVGGGSQSALLNQFAANATGRKVLAGPVEASAVGNALLQAMALGHIGSLSELREVVRASFPMEAFEPRDPAPWDLAFRRLGAF
jgi:rhamnulokinase